MSCKIEISQLLQFAFFFESSRTQPYAQRSRRKQDGLDNDYHPQDSPAYDQQAFPQANSSKKRKTTGKKGPRSKRPKHADIDSPMNKRSKKRKREDGSEGNICITLSYIL